MRLKNGAFTLIELLIVIAIIGILASVMLPQLLGARKAASKRAIQAHSANVYKAVMAILSEDEAVPVADVASVAQTRCTLPTPSLTIGVKIFKYGWNQAASATDVCTVTAINGNDFQVSVKGNSQADNLTSINGQRAQ